MLYTETFKARMVRRMLGPRAVSAHALSGIAADAGALAARDEYLPGDGEEGPEQGAATDGGRGGKVRRTGGASVEKAAKQRARTLTGFSRRDGRPWRLA
jgi:hypothetical protein